MWGKAMMLRNAAGSLGFRLNQNSRWSHTAALQAPLERVMDLKNETESVGKSGNKQSMEAPHFGFGGSMELMAVPKKKVSPYKRGLRNGPKALKPVPVIMRCRCFEVVLGLTMNTWRAWFESAGAAAELSCHISTVAVGIGAPVKGKIPLAEKIRILSSLLSAAALPKHVQMD